MYHFAFTPFEQLIRFHWRNAVVWLELFVTWSTWLFQDTLGAPSILRVFVIRICSHLSGLNITSFASPSPILEVCLAVGLYVTALRLGPFITMYSRQSSTENRTGEVVPEGRL